VKTPFLAPVSGPAYPIALRLGASVLTLLILVAGAAALDALAQQPPRAWLLPGAGLAVLAGSYYFLMRSVTTIDERGIRQSGLIERRVEWSELRSARVAGFGTARRLLVRTESGKFRVFFGGTPELAQAFVAIASAHPPGASQADPR
jgi:hypothetical protein